MSTEGETVLLRLAVTRPADLSSSSSCREKSRWLCLSGAGVNSLGSTCGHCRPGRGKAAGTEPRWQVIPHRQEPQVRPGEAVQHVEQDGLRVHPPGSYLVVSHACSDPRPAVLSAFETPHMSKVAAQGRPRTRADITRRCASRVVLLTARSAALENGSMALRSPGTVARYYEPRAPARDAPGACEGL
jgi:hypothetical protein